MSSVNPREQLGSRIGFLFISAGCAIGLGNVWRFPFITGKYGGAAFVLIYLLFLFILGLPIMVMEFSIGRGGRQNIAGALKKLQPEGSKWHLYGYFAILGNLLLMMFYTTVAGWMLAYFYHTLTGSLAGLSPDEVGGFFGGLLASPGTLIFWMGLTVVLGFTTCSIGLQKGVETITKWMMSSLFIILIALVIKSVTLPGASAGLSFYLMPDLDRLMEIGVWETVYAAMGQAFFTLSLGIGSMAIFGSYIGKERSLTGESLNIIALDTFVAILSGLIIFPACFAFGKDPGAGPGLIFVTLPNIFNSMNGGRIWGSLFFLFLSFAAMSTVIAVFENIMAFTMEELGWSRKKAAVINCLLLFALSLPCALGFNLWSEIQPLGKGTGIIDLEDFIVGNNLLPIGSLVFAFFCSYKMGWGWDNFVNEANEGHGLRYPEKTKFYVKYILPLIILVVFIGGYIEKFGG
ncbi:sodium-dependent transporter [Desulfoluna sp.]|uniref:sodium-dependent transporter n=1 Tax=Desulfoluna sp. TaxID=2045199 RepID=UPI002618649C|nr:sodium-dependent transporter [Desulfoluna sp.]